jgi:predicted amidohydrolase YtcJ
MRILVSLALLASIPACGDAGLPPGDPLPPPTDFVLTGARIYTADEARPWAEALAVRDGRIVYVGDDAGALTFQEGGATHHDLDGKLVIPGLVDAHTHPGMVGFLGEDHEESPIPKTSHEEILSWLEDYAGWFWPPMILAGDWPTTLYGIQGPRKEELDRLVRWRPVILFDDSGHSQWMNSAALKLLGVDASTPDPAPGLSYFVRDENGEPTGWVKEFAGLPFVGDLLLPPRGEMAARMLTFMKFLSERGVTTLFDAGNLLYDDEVYSIVAELEREGRLPLRYLGVVHIVLPDQLDTAVSELERLRREYGGDLLQFDTIKIHFDGVQEIRTAAMLDPYLGEGTGRGETLFTLDRLRDFILELHTENIDLHLHTVGDRAIRIALDAVEQARSAVSGDLACHVSVSHLEVMDDLDIPRFRELGVAADYTPHWHGGYFEGSHLTVGEPRSSRVMRAQPLLEDGAVVSFSSDITTYAEMERANPFFGMQIAHNRQEVEDGPDGAVMLPLSERLGREELVQGYTRGGASQLQLDDELGSITVGKAADLVVLSEDLFTVDRYAIHRVRPDAVVMQGRVVHGRLP